MGVTKRVTGTPSGGATKRLTPALRSDIDPWNRAWGDRAFSQNSWGASWATSGFGLGLVANQTKRVTGTPTGGVTKRLG